MDVSDDPLGLQGIGESWEFLKQNRYLPKLEEFVREERRSYPLSVYPSAPDVFAWTRYCTPSQVKVVIVGQDPYANGEGHGLAFSTLGEGAKPPALTDIFKAIEKDLGFQPSAGNLSSWARQGVLLLNRILTFREEKPRRVDDRPKNAHEDKGWEEFTKNVIEELSDKYSSIVFLLWGNEAKKVKESIKKGKNHKVLECVLPTAYGDAFVKECEEGKYFSATNDYLKKHKPPPIDWQTGSIPVPNSIPSPQLNYLLLPVVVFVIITICLLLYRILAASRIASWNQFIPKFRIALGQWFPNRGPCFFFK